MVLGKKVAIFNWEYLNSAKHGPNLSTVHAHESRIKMANFNALFFLNCASNAHTPKIRLSKGDEWGKEILLCHSRSIKVTSN